MRALVRLVVVTAILLPLLLPGAVVPPPAAATGTSYTPPTTLVETGVTSFALGGPRLIWHTHSNCGDPELLTPAGAKAAQASEDPELIRRMFRIGSLPRILFRQDPTRPPGTCNPYHVRSDVLADAQYVYWADDGGLKRLSVHANEGDEPGVMSGLIKSAGDNRRVGLAQNDSFVYASIHDAANKATIYRIAKSDFSVRVVRSFAGPVRNLQADEDYVYWIASEMLQRGAPVMVGFTVVDLASGVSGYFPEGERPFCTPSGLCSHTHFVYIARGSQVVRYNNTTGATSAPIYTSGDSHNPRIYELVTEANHLFVLESREYLPCPDCFFDYHQVLIRMGRDGATPEPLYEHVSPLSGYLDTFNLENDGGYLYWQEGAAILKLPNEAERLPQTNMTISRIEVTQGIQTTNNDVKLLQERRTFVRVFARAANGEVPGVTLFLYRLAPNTGARLDGPLAPINASGTHLTVFSDEKAELEDGAFLFELPMAWVSGEYLKLEAVLNPYNTPLESNPDDNTAITAAFELFRAQRLEVDFYVFGYVIDNVTYFPNAIQDVQAAFSWIRRMYPVGSAPGSGADPTAGLRPNVHYIIDNNLISRLDLSHQDCKERDEEEKGFCAADYIRDLLDEWQDRDAAEEETPVFNIKYGMWAVKAGRGRGRGGQGWHPFEQRYWAHAAGPTGPANNGWDADGFLTDWYTAHELGHALGRGHPSKGLGCGQDPSDDDFPYDGARIGPDDGSRWAFDAGDPLLGAPRRIGTARGGSNPDWTDGMAYCDWKWLSDYNYDGLYRGISKWNGAQASTAALSTEESQDALVLFGTLWPGRQSADLFSVRRQSVRTLAAPHEGRFAARLLDGNGEELATWRFRPDQAEEDGAGRTFHAALPFTAGARRVQIVDLNSNAVWAEQELSAHAPTVENVTVTAATTPVTGTATVRWTGADEDGDALTFDVLASRDGGATFQPVVVGVGGDSAAVDTVLLGGGNTILRVTASDGVLSASADSQPITIAPKPPRVLISNPADGTVVQWGQQITLIGEGLDVQDGSVAGEKLVWSNQKGELGRGAILSIADLPVGENQIVLTATNSAGLSASSAITVIVEDDFPVPGPTLAAGPTHFGWHVASGETAIQQAPLHIVDVGSGELTWTASSDAAWMSLGATSGDAPATITVTADPAGMPDDSSRVAHILISATGPDGQPAGSQRIRVTLSMGNTWPKDEPASRQLSLYLPLARR